MKRMRGMRPEHITAYLCIDSSILFISYRPGTPALPKAAAKGRRFSAIQKSIESMLMTAMANRFAYWVTLSFQSDKDIIAFRRWRALHYPEMRYVEVAIQSYGREDKPHPNDERWHIHMLASGIPAHELAPKFSIEPYSVVMKASRPKQQYRWTEAERHFSGAPNMTDVQRIGDLNWYNEPIQQVGKAIYMARQFEEATRAVFAPRRRLYNTSQGLRKSLRVIGEGELPTAARKALFDYQGTYPFALDGHWGAYAGTAGGRVPWTDTIREIGCQYAGVYFSSPWLPIPVGAPF